MARLQWRVTVRQVCRHLKATSCVSGPRLDRRVQCSSAPRVRRKIMGEAEPGWLGRREREQLYLALNE